MLSVVNPIEYSVQAPEETNNRESVNKRKRGQPRKFISTEPKEKTGMLS